MSALPAGALISRMKQRTNPAPGIKTGILACQGFSQNMLQDTTQEVKRSKGSGKDLCTS